MDSIFLVSLTPDFSGVSGATQMMKPFQRFPGESAKAVETASTSLGLGHTWLKPGVNDIALFLATHSL
jgi:hypothetical protein